MLSFEDLRKANEARQKEWDGEQKLSVLYYANAIAGETGELCNVVKKLERAAMGLAGTTATFEDMAAEAADILIYLDLLAQCAGFRLEDAVIEKFNRTSRKLGFATAL